jgi:hypothetical protein
MIFKFILDSFMTKAFNPNKDTEIDKSMRVRNDFIIYIPV